MKKLTSLLSGILLLSSVVAQKPFPMVYKSAWPINVSYRYSNTEKTLALGGDMRAISMLDATNGKVLWTMEFKDKLGVKKANDWGWEKDLGYVWVKINTDDKSIEQTLYFDEKTGEKISDISNLKPKAIKYGRSRANRNYSLRVDDEDRNLHISLDYKMKLAGSAIGKGTKTNLTLNCTGSQNWSTDFQGYLIRALCQNAMGSLYGDEWGGDYINVMLVKDKIFVIYEGISVFDVNGGKLLWETTFDNSDFDFGIVKSVQTLGKAGVPLVTENGVYVADLSKGNHKIKKFDVNTGKVLWESESLDKDAIVPDLFETGNTLIARFGGEIQVQTSTTGSGNVPATCRVEYKMEGPFGVKAFDANTGQKKWDTDDMTKTLGDKFKGSISNILQNKNQIIFATSKNMICLEMESGNLVWKTDLSKPGIGNTNYIWYRNGAVIAEGSTGIGSIDFSSGKLNFGTKTKKNFGTFGTTDALYVWVSKDQFDHRDFVRVDLDKGGILGIQKSTKYPQFDPMYEDFLKYDGNKIWRFKTRP